MGEVAGQAGARSCLGACHPPYLTALPPSCGNDLRMCGHGVLWQAAEVSRWFLVGTAPVPASTDLRSPVSMVCRRPHWRGLGPGRQVAASLPAPSVHRCPGGYASCNTELRSLPALNCRRRRPPPYHPCPLSATQPLQPRPPCQRLQSLCFCRRQVQPHPLSEVAIDRHVDSGIFGS